MMLHSWKVWGLILIAGATLGTGSVAASPPPAVKDTMDFTPKQRDVEYETPKPEEFAKCKVEVERKGKGSGWVVIGPAGQVLRKFLDTDGDNKLDQWRYFNHGIEVYRDIDTNDNDKVDQSRWLNLGGSKWGLDQNEDGRIDVWKVLSAAEAAKEAIRAMVTGDDLALQLVMASPDDLHSIGLNQEIAAKVLESTADAGKKARAVVSKSRVLTPQTRWARFDSQMPGTIPQDDDKAATDVQIYENAMAIVEVQGKFVGVQIGEMVRIGEVWKLTQVPQPIEEGTMVTAGGILMQPLAPAGAGPANQGNPELEKALVELQKLEQDLMRPNVDRKTIKTLMARRSELYKRGADLAQNDDEKQLLTKQMVEGTALAAQMGNYPDGAAELRTLELDLRRRTPKSPLVPYVAYRRLQSQYYVDLQQAEKEKDKASEIQKEWIRGMEDFVKEFPDAEDTADAMLLLANNEEITANVTAAAEWYQRLVRERPKTDAGARAAGALRRLDLKGKPLVLSGPGIDGGQIDVRAFQGKTVLVVFWATEYRVCEEDLPQLRALYQEYRNRGFEILGVCLDLQKEAVKPYMAQHKITWPQIYQPGGMSSPAALGFGVNSLPTMFLVNGKGVVVSHNATIQDVKTALPPLLSGK